MPYQVKCVDIKMSEKLDLDEHGETIMRPIQKWVFRMKIGARAAFRIERDRGILTRQEIEKAFCTKYNWLHKKTSGERWVPEQMVYDASNGYAVVNNMVDRMNNAARQRRNEAYTWATFSGGVGITPASDQAGTDAVVTASTSGTTSNSVLFLDMTLLASETAMEQQRRIQAQQQQAVNIVEAQRQAAREWARRREYELAFGSRTVPTPPADETTTNREG